MGSSGVVRGGVGVLRVVMMTRVGPTDAVHGRRQRWRHRALTDRRDALGAGQRGVMVKVDTWEASRTKAIAD